MVVVVVVAMAAASLCCGVAAYLYYVLWLAPERLRAHLRRQGIGGPIPSFPYGNLADMRSHAAAAAATGKATGEGRQEGDIVHDYRQAVFPFYENWRKQYGPVFTYSVGNMVFLHVSRPDIVRELSLCVSLDLGKSSYMKATHQPLFGEGILKSNGNAWAHQRKLIAPEFFPDKVKGMVDLMVDSAQVLVSSWGDRIDRSGGNALDLMIDDDIRAYSADVISRTCFGSSYVKGKQIFDMIRELQKTVSTKKQNLLAEMTGLSFLFPTASGRAAWRLNGRVRALILDLVGENGEEDGGNLLSAMLRSARGGGEVAAAAEDFVVDNCKNIYFAGYESTAVTAAWCLMLLALHPEWQDRVRDEVQAACCGGGGRSPDFPALQKMKNLTMVIQETLRLYPAGAVVSRQALRELSLGGVRVPRGVNIYVPVSTMHLDAELWGGAGAAEVFDPARFADARPPLHAYLPFGAGARTCLGQTFAMAELKVLLSLVLCRFEVALSPEYVHSPAHKLIVEAEHGVRLVLKKVRSKCNWAGFD
uniref:Cytochrome P450 n=1 Tax=Oryza meridionalis TaxID=40149 RepID=A0A0E0EG95_9ORYZ